MAREPIKLANSFREEIAEKEKPNINVVQHALMDMKALLETDRCNLTMSLLNRNALMRQIAALERSQRDLKAMPQTEHIEMLLENNKKTLAQARLVAQEPAIPRDKELTMLALSCIIEADRNDTIAEAVAAALDRLDQAAGSLGVPSTLKPLDDDEPEDPVLLPQSEPKAIDIKAPIEDDGLPDEGDEPDEVEARPSDDEVDDIPEEIVDPNERSVKL